MSDRITKVKGRLAELGLDSYLVSSNENKNYLVGFEDESVSTGVDSFLLLTENVDYLIVEVADLERAAWTSPGCKVLPVADKEPLGVTVKGIVEKEGLKKIGYEGNILKQAYYADVLEYSPDVEMVPASQLIEKFRSVKDAEEIEKIAKSIAIGDEAYEFIMPRIKAGRREKDVAWDMEVFARHDKGAEGLAFKTIVASGLSSSSPHGPIGFASDKLIEAGDFVTVDYGVMNDCYCGDMTRTFVMGEPTKEQEKIYSIVLEAQLAGVAAAKAGMVAKDLDKVARDIIESYGYGEYFMHELGHSMGLKCHEIPMVGDYDETILEPGMIVTIEPGIYIPNWGGVRIEDTVVIEEGGCRVLPKFTKELQILEP